MPPGRPSGHTEEGDGGLGGRAQHHRREKASPPSSPPRTPGRGGGAEQEESTVQFRERHPDGDTAASQASRSGRPSPPTEREAPGPTRPGPPSPPRRLAHCLAGRLAHSVPFSAPRGPRLCLPPPLPARELSWTGQLHPGPRPLFLSRDTRGGSYSPEPMSFRPERKDSMFETLPVTQGEPGRELLPPTAAPRPCTPPALPEHWPCASCRHTRSCGHHRAGRPGSVQGTPGAPRRHGRAWPHAFSPCSAQEQGPKAHADRDGPLPSPPGGTGRLRLRGSGCLHPTPARGPGRHPAPLQPCPAARLWVSREHGGKGGQESWLTPSVLFCSPEATKICRETSYSTEVKTVTQSGQPQPCSCRDRMAEHRWQGVERGRGMGDGRGAHPCAQPLAWASTKAPAIPSRELPERVTDSIITAFFF